jgi:hypothetical protein
VTTQNHTLIAGAVAVMTQDASNPWKIVILIILALAHIPCDMIPHQHLWDADRLKETIKGAAAELGVGLIILPILISLLSATNFWWIFYCVFAASLFDFGVAGEKILQKMGVEIKVISTINHAAHFWESEERGMTDETKWRWEASQTIILLCVMGYIMTNWL